MPDLIDIFWSEVQRLLVLEHGFAPGLAQAETDAYRANVSKNKVADTILHFGPARVAEWMKVGPQEQLVTQNVVKAAHQCTPSEVIGRHPASVPAFVTRLSASVLGHTPGHGRGYVIVPKTHAGFFPPLHKTARAREATFQVSFENSVGGKDVRLVEYRSGGRTGYRIAKLPEDVLYRAKPGDLLVLAKPYPEHYRGILVLRSDPRHRQLADGFGSSENARITHVSTDFFKK
jgi:hypothetical protein